MIQFASLLPLKVETNNAVNFVERILFMLGMASKRRNFQKTLAEKLYGHQKAFELLDGHGGACVDIVH